MRGERRTENLRPLGLRTTRVKLAIGIGLLGTMPLVLLAAVTTTQQHAAAIDDTFDALDGVADAQVGHLERLIENDAEIANLLAANGQVQAMLRPTAEPAPVGARRTDTAIEEMVASSERLVNVTVHRSDGTTAATTDPGAIDRYHGQDITPVDEPYRSRIIMGADDVPISLTTARVAVNGVELGSVTIETSATEIARLAATFTLLNSTGETSVAQRGAGGAQLIVPLRFSDDSVITTTIPDANVEAPIIRALAGEEGRFDDTIDYRQQDVLAVTRHIEATDWGVVVKIDRSEALAGVDDFYRTVVLALILAVLLAAVVAIVLSRSVWRPISRLTAAASAVADGDRTTRAAFDRRDELGRLAYAVNAMTDELVSTAGIDAQRRASVERLNLKLARGERELAAIFENAVDGIITADPSGRIRRMNVAAASLLDIAPDQIEPSELGIAPAETPTVFDVLSVDGVPPSKLLAAAVQAGPDGLDMKATNRSQGIVPVHVTVSFIDDDDGLYTAIIRDMSERHALQERLGFQATHDSLTGLPNRSYVRDQLEEALVTAATDHVITGLLFIDLDHFKTINDSRGHEIGDRLLHSVAERLHDAARDGDIVARLGGDEFVLLCPNVKSSSNAVAVAARLHDAMDESFLVDGQDEHVACSIGVALSRGEHGPDELMSNADLAMYQAKSSGRNRTVVYDSGMRRAVEARHDLSGALHQAIQSDEITVVYQPIIDIGSGEIHAVEALARWERPGLGPVSPGEFIPLAEESGLIVELGKSVFAQVCEQQVRWANDHPNSGLKTTVNLSARELIQPDCVSNIESIIHRTGASPTAMVLEMTETAFSANLRGVGNNLHRLRELGFTIALDDFGTGYSSLTYLRQFPIDIVKIDRSFMVELAPESADSSILSLVMNLGRTVDITVIAEGVETDDQLRVLQQLGCRFAQGYLFARPLGPPAIAELVWPDFDHIDVSDFDTAP